MFFNFSKCKIANKKITSDSMHGFMEQHQICKSINIPYLGVTIREHLTWTDHIERIDCKANSVNAFLRRNINSCHSYITKCVIWLWYILYWNTHQLFGPHTLRVIYINQKWFSVELLDLLRITIHPASVTEMLHNLNLPTLEKRRNTLTELVLMYKILHKWKAEF